jgi:3-hydroxyisobutyrate dehydrogenase
VVGTKGPAESGTLVVLASGRSDLIEEARPVFDAIGSRVVVAGQEIGEASALKLVVNSWVALMASGIAQSMAFARSLGLDPTLFLEALDGGPTSAPYVNLKGRNILEGDYATSFAVDGVVKDVGLMIETARSVGFPTDLMSTVRDLYSAAADLGHGGDDMAAVTFAFEH